MKTFDILDFGQFPLLVATCCFEKDTVGLKSFRNITELSGQFSVFRESLENVL